MGVGFFASAGPGAWKARVPPGNHQPVTPNETPMADLLTLEILTPQKRVLSAETPWVTLPGSEGELGILPQHVPLVTAMGSGVLAYEEDGQRKQAAVHYGYVQVAGDRVTLLSQMVETSGEIDLERARESLDPQAVQIPPEPGG